MDLRNHENLTPWRWYHSFLSVSVLWLMLSFVIMILSTGSIIPEGLYLFGFWLLSMLNLGALAKTGLVVISMYRGQKGLKREFVFWGLTKMTTFSIFSLVFWSQKELPPTPTLLGMGTLIVVPIVGSLLEQGSHLITQEGQTN